MKGLIVRFPGELIKMALPKGLVSITLSNKYINEEYFLDCSGLDMNGRQYVWKQELLEIGDIITVEISDIRDDEVSAAEMHGFQDHDAENRKLLECYRRLKEELTKAKII